MVRAQPENGFLGAVGRFLFSPTDATTLGFMRIVTGLILLYTHAVYSLDLQAFFGPYAWWDQQAANTQRREAPYVPSPLGWSEFWPTIYVDETPHRRAAVIEYLASLPLDKHERAFRTRYLGRILDRNFGLVNTREGLFFANSVERIERSQHARVVEALRQPKVPDEGTPIHIPDFIRQLPPDERLVVWQEVLDFNATLPSDSEKQEYILGWIDAYPQPRRHLLYPFLAGTRSEDGRDLSLPSDPRELKEFLDFLERWGGDTRQTRSKGTAVFSQWYHLTDPTTMRVVHGFALLVFALFTIGLWTRTTSVLTWILSLTYIHRGQITLFGQDTMQTILLMYLMIGPSGATLSIDALLKRYRAARAIMSGGNRPLPWAEAALAGPERSWLANFAIRLLQINYCLIYASAGLSKLKGSTWWEHSAAWLVMINPEFGLVRYKLYEWFMRWLVEERLLLSVISACISAFTLTLELGFPTLVWTRMRPFCVSCAVLLHFGISLFMGLNVFGLYMFALLLCFFPAALIRERMAWSPGDPGPRLTVFYDSRSPRGVRKAALIRALDVAAQVTFNDRSVAKGPVDDTVRMLTAHGAEVVGRDLYRTALRDLVLLRPVRFLGLIPGAWSILRWRFGGVR